MGRKIKLKTWNISALLALVGIIVVTTRGFENKKNEFKTYKGTRNIRDYEEFLDENNIDYRNSYAESEGNIVKIKEKHKGKHIITEDCPNTINKIVELYKMDKQKFLKMNNLTDGQPLKIGMELKIYWYEEHIFTLEELDESSKWIYHYVMPGDTLEQISEKYNISEEEIKRNNPKIFNEDEIKTYSTIKIPKQKTNKLIKK